MIFVFRSLLIAIPLLLVACSSDENDSATTTVKKTSKPAALSYRVTETFNVGNNVFVRSLAFDKKAQSLWVGTSVGALEVNTLTGNVVNTYTRDNGLANEYVFASYSANNGDTWLGTNGGGVSRLTQSNQWQTYFPMHGLADYWVYSFAEQPDKAMWIGTWAGLSKLDYATGEFATYLKELVNEWVYGLAIDQQGDLWIGTEGGVNRFDGTKWDTWTHDDGLGAPNTANLEFSPNTGLGTRSRHDLSITLNGKETYNPNYVFCIAVASDNSVWAGTWGGGVSFFDGKQWQNLTVDDGLAGNIVYSIVIDNDQFWFGTNNGLSIYQNGEWVNLNKSQGLLDSHVYALAIDDQQRIWAGTRHGVALLEATN